MNAIITNVDQDIISAIKSILKFHPTAKIEVSNVDEIEHCISKEDEIKLKEIYERNKRGEVRFFSIDETIESSNEVLRKFGANV